MAHHTIKKTYSETGVVCCEFHFRSHEERGERSRLHRDPAEGPAYIYRYEETGAPIEERYYWCGRLHRYEGPAVLEYNPIRAFAWKEKYYRHGFLHRNPKDGPAWIERDYESAAILCEVYYVNGRPFRDPKDGPYHIQRNKDGVIFEQVYSEPRARRAHRRPGPRGGPGPSL